jgi:hypothetical protein
MSEMSEMALDYLFGDRSVFESDEDLNAAVRQVSDQLRGMTAAPQGLAGTCTVDVCPVRPGDEHGTLILHGGPEADGVICYCPVTVANYARTLIAAGDTPTVTLDRHGNVVSVQTAEGHHRTEFPKAA